MGVGRYLGAAACAAALISTSGCAAVVREFNAVFRPQANWTPEQKAQRKLDAEKAAHAKRLLESEPTTFVVPKDQLTLCWGRATAAVANRATMKMQTASEFLMETYTDPSGHGVAFRVIQTPQADGSAIFQVVSNRALEAALVSRFTRTGQYDAPTEDAAAKVKPMEPEATAGTAPTPAASPTPAPAQ